MQYSEAKDAFIEAWGALGLSWGVNKTMAQIFALLLVSPNPLSVEDIMEELSISRGNSSMNLRALLDWGLIQKTTKKGERREYFTSNQSFWEVAKTVAQERSKREFDPMIKMLEQVKQLDTGSKDKESLYFQERVSEISEVVESLDQLLRIYVNSDRNWITDKLIALLKKTNKQK